MTSTQPQKLRNLFRRLAPLLLPERCREEKGQALAEFGIIATVLMLIVMGILYFGRYLNYSQDQMHLANIAARWAAVGQDPGCSTSGGSCTNLYQYVQGLAEQGELQSGSTDVAQKATVCISLPTDASGNSGQQGDPVQVTVTAKYNLPFLTNFASPFTVTETATMPLETPMSSTNNEFIGSTGTC